LGAGSRRIYDLVRRAARFQDVDRPMEREVADVAAQIASGLI
jgi:histidine ammonia-lyase